MKKRYKLLALTGTLTVGIIAYSLLFQPRVWLSVPSPNEVFVVELTGDKSRPRFPFREHEVRFSVVRGGNAFVRDAYAHSGDWFDPGFEDSYPEHVWVAENILRFGRNISAAENGFDTIVVSNHTDKVIRYLKLNSGDMFLIFEVQPHSTLRLAASRQPWQSWVAGEGEFADGQRISWNGVNFFHRNKSSSPPRYCVSVNEDALRIESVDIEGYNRDGSGDNPNIVRAASCTP